MNVLVVWFIFIIACVRIDITEGQCPPTKASIQYLLDEAFIPGAAIVVVDSNKIIYQQGVGYHSPPISEERQPVDPSSSIFILASISKTFIAVAVMQMVESNRLDLDTDINQYLPSTMHIVHPHYPNTIITIRHLLTHSSGIGPNPVEESQHYIVGDGFTQTNLGDVIHKYLNNNASWLPIPPGNKTLYSNVATSLAAFIVERVAGMRYESYVQEKILKILGIDKSKAGYRLSNFQGNEKNLVGHYVYNASWLETFQEAAPHVNISLVGNLSEWVYVPLFGSSTYPSGFLRMSAHSLGLFLQSFLNKFPTLLHNLSSVEQMLHISPQESYMNRSESKYGLIWTWANIDGRLLVGHQGSLPGISTLMMANEKRNLGVVILTNGDFAQGQQQDKKVRDTIYKLTNQLFNCFETKKV